MMMLSVNQLIATVLLAVVSPAVSANIREQYIGCYRDGGENNRVMTGSRSYDRSMTVDMCHEHCQTTVYTYFGLEYHYECFCGDIYNRLGPADNCDTACGGDYRDTCGGERALSVYSVCPFGFHGRDCDDRCSPHCSETERCFRNATCVGGCQPGWTGLDCETDVDECQRDKGGCAQRCVNSPGNYTCHCFPGYETNDDGKTCSDIDECAEVDKGGCQQVCMNTGGSYVCVCGEGFYVNVLDYKTCLEVPSGCDCLIHKTATTVLAVIAFVSLAFNVLPPISFL